MKPVPLLNNQTSYIGWKGHTFDFTRYLLFTSHCNSLLLQTRNEVIHTVQYIHIRYFSINPLTHNSIS